LMYENCSIKIYSTRVPFGFSQDKLPMKPPEAVPLGTKIIFKISNE